ncbi:hypothetical protein FG379_002140 [Cryptosporidium bovis]|uniref:uncharacterized protein n=1 Tax=Cryptosporidium bovis TaxID=310047 RepID=UPI00351A8F70|nr:hypothetical protein FG379_002140 [Cryptosporidium bovis]
MLLAKDVTELDGLLELYDWIQNYDKEKVPTKKKLFLIVKKKLNLFLINKKSISTPKSVRSTNYKLRKNGNEFSSEKCDRNSKIDVNGDSNNNIIDLNNNRLNLNIRTKLRPSTYCSIYPISTFSKIHNIIENNSAYNNNNNSENIVIEKVINQRKLNDDSQFKNETDCVKYSNDNTTETDYDYDDNKYSSEFCKEKTNKYRKKIDIKTLNSLLTYLEEILKTKKNKKCSFELTVYKQQLSNFCFLTFWKKIEEILNIQQSYEFNDETIIWQQLRDVLLLTGMSLKYPTWSGEQLSNIIARIIPKKGLNVIFESKEFFVSDSNSGVNMLNNDMNEMYSGLINLYFTFNKHPTTTFDVITVSKLIQENIRIYVNKSKVNIKNILDISGKEDNFIDNSNIVVSDIDSSYNTSNEYEYQVDDDYVSSFESNDYICKNKEINVERGVKLVNNLGLFANKNDIERIFENNYLFNSCKGSTASSMNETEYIKTSDHFEYQIFESTKNISENMINLGISKKLIEEIILNNFSSEGNQLERKVLKDVCDIIEDSINNSNTIVSYVNENYIDLNSRNMYKTIKILFALVLLAIGIFVSTDNNETISNIFNYGKSATIQAYRVLTDKNGNYSLTDLYQNNMIKSTDCILKKWDNINIEDNSICNAIGDITVIERCFTNIDKMKSI